MEINGFLWKRNGGVERLFLESCGRRFGIESGEGKVEFDGWRSIEER